MASSLAAQLGMVRASTQVETQLQAKLKTQSSILFSPKEAAELSDEHILGIALEGLEVLASMNESFKNYKNKLFSHKEIYRESMSVEQNESINTAVASYLRLLQAYLLAPSALQTIEYLIRKYRIHVYNKDEFILCALLYHETPVFVRIVQLIETGNSKWKFLDGVKEKGASPPRKVIVNQCTRDMGVLEVYCDYASPTKKYRPSSEVVRFCTCLVIETLGAMTEVDSDITRRILPFVFSGLKSGANVDLDHKAGSLMIVALLSSKVALSQKLVNTLIRLIVEAAQDDAKDSNGMQWDQWLLMALINLVQHQSIDMFPKKALDVLKETSDFGGVLLSISDKIEKDKFLAVLLDTLIEFSFDDDACQTTLLSILENVPMKNLVHRVVCKIFSSCLKVSKKKDRSISGRWAKKALMVVYKNYPSEFCGAFQKFLSDKRMQSDKEFEILWKALNGDLNISLPLSDSNIWLSSHHPKPEVRRAALSALGVSDILIADADDSQGLDNVRDAVLRGLHDDNLTVVREALSLKELPAIVDNSNLFEALYKLLKRCTNILNAGSSEQFSIACDVACLCIETVILNFNKHSKYSEKIAAMVFPFLLITPKMKLLNMKALELVKEVNWPLYQNIPEIPNVEQNLDFTKFSAINMEIISSLSEMLSMHFAEYLPWLVHRCSDFKLSKTFFYLVLMQTIMTQINKGDCMLAFFEVCFPVLKSEWKILESALGISVKEFNTDVINLDCRKFLDQMFGANTQVLNANILICTFWRLIEVFASVPANDENDKWVSRLRDLFIFFADSNMTHVFREHIHYLIKQCKTGPVHFLSSFFAEEGIPVKVQIESLQCFAFLCCQQENSLLFDLLAEFSSIFVPLASPNQDIRVAAVGCIEGLCALKQHFDSSNKKNGKNANWSYLLYELLDVIVDQKGPILSDKEYFSSLLTSLLSSSSSPLLPKDIEKRFDQSKKSEALALILGSALKLSAYGKLAILSLIKDVGSAIVQVKEVRSLLSLLLERRNQYLVQLDRSCQKLSDVEIEILCILLQCCTKSSSFELHGLEEYLLKALHVGCVCLEDTAVIQPCITVLGNLSGQLFKSLKTETQESLFQELVFLFQNVNGGIHNATEDAIRRLHISSSSIACMLNSVVEEGGDIYRSPFRKHKKQKKQVQHHETDSPLYAIKMGEDLLPFVSSILDILLLKKDIENRHSLIGLLFKLLGYVFSDEGLKVALTEDEKLVETYSIQRTTLQVLEDVIASLTTKQFLKDEVANDVDVKLLVACANSAKDGITRNDIFSLLTTITKVIPNKILGNVLDILAVLGKSVVLQDDNNSQRIFEDLISAVVPLWLSKMDSLDDIFKVFINILPDIAEHRRLSVSTYLLRSLGESNSLAPFLVLLFRGMISRKGSCWVDDNSDASETLYYFVQREWEYVFAVQVSQQFSYTIWLPSLVLLLQKMRVGKYSQDMSLELLFAMQFIIQRLQDPEFAFQVKSPEESENIQGTLEELLAQVVSLLQIIDSNRKQPTVSAGLRKLLKSQTNAVICIITAVMFPSAFFTSIIKLLNNSEGNVHMKALGILCDTLKNQENDKAKKRDRKDVNLRSDGRWLLRDGKTHKTFQKLCEEIVRIIDEPTSDSDSALKLSAVSALEVLAKRFPMEQSVFSFCISSVARNITVQNLAVSSSCLRTLGVLIDVSGPLALKDLPCIMKKLVESLSEVPSCVGTSNYGNDNSSITPSAKKSFLMSVLVTLEAALEKLGRFMNPYLGDIMELMVLRPEYLSGSHEKLKIKSDVVRRLITTKIDVRVASPHFLRIYHRAVESGDLGLTIFFDMLANFVGGLEKSAVRLHYVKIFDLCLLALNLRHQRLASIQKIGMVEGSVVNAMMALTMKLTTSMFKPLFVRTVEWAVSGAEEVVDGGNIYRAISFYSLVNKLAENHRSLFVPYFKYILEDSVRHLTDFEDVKSFDSSRKKKKAKIAESGTNKKEQNTAWSTLKWHLRALIISSLHKCFLYDTGTLKFLDSANFQVLLKPVVSQLSIDPPSSLEEHSDVPSVNEVDDLLVSCVGQMAVNAGSDLLWKPLNHEVLMHTRSDKVRSRLLGLRIIKHLLQTLKEEYLVLLPETIPFLGEVLEDMELPVKSLAQDIFKEMESVSGENLRQYL